MRVEVVRSARRRKTVQARQVGGVLRVSIPATMSAAEEARWVAEMVRRVGLKQSTEAIDLARRAEFLAGRYGLPSPASIKWVDNQEWRWGSCTPADGTIRISSRLAPEPAWVTDYVIVHELAHLRVPGHNRAFWDLVYRYPLAERARGFLMARGAEPPGDEPGGEVTGSDSPAGGASRRRRPGAAAARPEPEAAARREGGTGRKKAPRTAPGAPTLF